jgi:hypothetical protein
MVIRPEDRQLLADFVNNLNKEERRKILDKLLKSILYNQGGDGEVLRATR